MQHDPSLAGELAFHDNLRLQWHAALLRLSLAWMALVLLFLPVWSQMAHQWWDISTYNHILVVPTIVAWLTWMRMPDLARLAPQAWWPGLFPSGACLLLWLFGDAAGLNIVTHIACVGMLAATVLLLLGPRVAVALAFPLFFMIFLVPFGDGLVPMLQQITARLCVTLAGWSGIPVKLDGILIFTPAGTFRVAEACSGVMFLVAMVALGALVAHLGFRSWGRRLALMAFAVILPVLANGVRAWGTVQIAQIKGVAFAAGFDHIFYGWIFFGIVIAIFLVSASRFFDRPADDSFVNLKRIEESTWLAIADRYEGRGGHVLAVFAIVVLGTVAWSSAARLVSQPAPLRIDLQEARGWREAENSGVRSPLSEAVEGAESGAPHPGAQPHHGSGDRQQRMDPAKQLS